MFVLLPLATTYVSYVRPGARRVPRFRGQYSRERSSRPRRLGGALARPDRPSAGEALQERGRRARIRRGGERHRLRRSGRSITRRSRTASTRTRPRQGHVALCVSPFGRQADEQARIHSERAAHDAYGDSASRSTAARCVTPARRSAAGGRAGCDGANRIWSRTPGEHMTSTDARGCSCVRRHPAGQARQRPGPQLDGASRRRPSKPAKPPPRRSTTARARSWFA